MVPSRARIGSARVDSVSVAARHDGQRAVFGGAGAARDRRVDQSRAVRRQRLGDRLRGVDLGGR